MPVIRHDSRQVVFKLGYCGAPGSGRSSSLTFIHGRIDRGRRSELAARETPAGRTLSFGFAPAESLAGSGYAMKFRLIAVPGRAPYRAAGQLALMGVDGVAFVADSQLDRMEDNLRAWDEMEQHLADNGLSLAGIPAVLQCNKRDLPGIAPVGSLEYLLNNRPHRLPAFESVATTGHGVFPALNSLAREVIRRFAASPHNPAPAAP